MAEGTLDRGKCSVLVVDDDAAMVTLLSEELSELGYCVTAVSNSGDAAEYVRDPVYDVLVTDMRMPGSDGLELLAASRRSAPDRPVIVMTAFGAIDSAVESLRKGAYHYLLKPFKSAELDLFILRALEERSLRRETSTLKRALAERASLGGLVTASDAMREVCDLVERVADADVPVLLVGETGTGKGVIARALHAQSPRRANVFVSVNCAALPEALLESELFGHMKGAFTGATSNRPGLFVEADGGTLFLDEIGDMVPALQAKLLDVLERRVVRALGASREREVDVRVVAATHRDLRERVAQGLFREDLLYRLEGVSIEIPPLRQRRDDIPVLAERFLAEARESSPRSKVERLSRDVLDRMLEYPWPGNVRELKHAVSRVVLLGRECEAKLCDLPRAIAERSERRTPIDFGETVLPVRELQRRYAVWVLERAGGRKSIACEQLGIDGKTLNKWLASEAAERDD